MHEESPDRLEKLTSGIFRKIDIVEIDLSYEQLHDKKIKDDFVTLLDDTNFLDELEVTLKRGPLWKFNPTCLSLFIIDNEAQREFRYDRERLKQSVLEKGRFSCVEIDRNMNLYRLLYTIRVLLINANEIDSKLISKSKYVCVDTLTGKVMI